MNKWHTLTHLDCCWFAWWLGSRSHPSAAPSPSLTDSNTKKTSVEPPTNSQKQTHEAPHTVRALTSKMCFRQSDWVAFFFNGASPMNCIRSGGTDKWRGDGRTEEQWSHFVFVIAEALTLEALDRQVIHFRIIVENKGLLHGDLNEKKPFIQCVLKRCCNGRVNKASYSLNSLKNSYRRVSPSRQGWIPVNKIIHKTFQKAPRVRNCWLVQ